MAIKKPELDQVAKVVQPDAPRPENVVQQAGEEASKPLRQTDAVVDLQYAHLGVKAPDTAHGMARHAWYQREQRKADDAAAAAATAKTNTATGKPEAQTEGSQGGSGDDRGEDGDGSRRPSRPPPSKPTGIPQEEADEAVRVARERAAQVRAEAEQTARSSGGDDPLKALGETVVAPVISTRSGPNAPPPPPAVPSKVTTATGLQAVSIPVAASPNTATDTNCPRCGSVRGIKAGMRYCSVCGYDIQSKETVILDPERDMDKQEWHVLDVADNSVNYGPYSKAEIIEFYDHGQVNEDTKVFRRGMPKWEPLGTLTALIPLPAKKAPPPEVVATPPVVVPPVVSAIPPAPPIVPAGHERFVPRDMLPAPVQPPAASVSLATADPPRCGKCGTLKKLPTDRNCRTCGTPHGAPAPVQSAAPVPCKCGKCGTLKKLPTDRNCRTCGTPFPTS